MEIHVKSPAFCATDRQRNRELAQLAGETTRQAVLAFLEAGWRECEVALAFANAFEDYCLYLAERPGVALKAANGNRADKESAAN
jgi:hypothetical protein